MKKVMTATKTVVGEVGTAIVQLLVCLAVSIMIATAVVMTGFAIGSLKWLLT